MFRIRLKNIVDALYSNLPYQCRICGLRFLSHSVFKQHTDEVHFVRNERKFRKDFRDKTILETRKEFMTVKQWIGQDCEDPGFNLKTKEKKGLIEMYDASTDDFVGKFDLAEVIPVSEIKSSYIS